MGTRLVDLVLGRWTGVSDRGFRCLIRMARMALDDPTSDTPAEHYFGGHELLAMTFRRQFPTAKDAAAEKLRASRLRDVRTAIAELKKASAIDEVGRTPGGRRVYRLHLDRGSNPLSPQGLKPPVQQGLTPPVPQGLKPPPYFKGRTRRCAI